jgi:predicted RNA-binding protein with PUA-like domain
MPTRRSWLMKSEPGAYAIDDLARDRRTFWNGVRNYQARNFMRDGMKAGDLVLFYHSNAEPPGVAGLARVTAKARPEPDDPVWVGVDLAFVERFSRILPLAALKAEPALRGMLVLKRGMRLSVQPVAERHLRKVLTLARAAAGG